ncbi:hypothetical protein AQUCO_00600245v1 [Aquilegia coerulea]|nr:hypothetical protein AQUCO_00600245v1 [Aquilegia coerulea]PIA57373.1 hypothetical protein AQUCO_00600245v1 [Aquilegia coerulea]
MASLTNRPRRSNRVNIHQSIPDQPRAKWTLYLTKTLADFMVEQVYRGNRQNNSFGKKAWECMCNDFQRKTGLFWDKEQLKNRFGVMKKQYATLKSLLDLNDFSWDEQLSMVKATDEVWDEYIKAHPDAEAIRTNGCPYYKQLCIIFGESKYNDNYDQLNHPMNIDENGVFLEGATTAGMPIDFGAASIFAQDESSSSAEENGNLPNEQNKCETVLPRSTGPRKRNRAGTEDIMVRAILDIAAASKLRTAAVSQSIERFSISNCIGALNEMQGVDDRLYYSALDLFDKPNARETFMSLKVEKRLIWLKSKCNAPFIA